jgi:hypothetical protein
MIECVNGSRLIWSLNWRQNFKNVFTFTTHFTHKKQKIRSETCHQTKSGVGIHREAHLTRSEIYHQEPLKPAMFAHRVITRMPVNTMKARLLSTQGESALRKLQDVMQEYRLAK